MSVRENTKVRPALRCARGACRDGSFEFIGEEPLSIRVDDRPYAVVMRTPGEEVAHAAGFCLAEGIVDSPDDFETVGYDEKQDPNVIDAWLRPERRDKVRDLLKRRVFTSQTSCGICGKEMIKDLKQILAPAEDGFQADIDQIHACIDKLDENQKYYQTTRYSHAALILDDRLKPVSFAEDVGRHNALDKAIGKAFMERKLSRARIAVLSSRNSYELVQKAARARLPMMISVSRATALAAELGAALNMTLVFPAGSELVIVCGQHRIGGV
jgi:FdhD protein